MKNVIQEEVSFWETCRSRCIQIYLAFIMVVYVLYCKSGFAEYDTNKRNLYLFGAVIFLAAFVLILLLSVMNDGKEWLKNRFEKTDLWLVGLLAVWVIGWIGSADKKICFWGDSYREMGFAFLGLGVFTMLIISKFVKWDIWLTRIFLLANAVVFLLQIMNFLKIDPFGWTNYGEIHYLMSTLGNINQNAAYNAIILSIILVMLMFSKDKNSTVIFSVMSGLAFAGGVASQSATFYLGIIFMLMVCGWYVLLNPEYLWRVWLVSISFVAGDIVLMIFNKLIRPYNKFYDPITLLLFDIKTIFILIIFVALLGLVCWKGQKFLEKNGRFISKIYLAMIILVIVALAVCYLIANLGNGEGWFSRFVLVDTSLSNRKVIWSVSSNLFAKSSFFHKMFGYGLGEYSSAIYLYEPERLNIVFPGQVLADGHNMFFDMLITSGILGIVCYFGFMLSLFVKSIRLLETNKVGLYGAMMIATYFGVCLVNSNLIIISQICYIILAVVYSITSRCEKGELVNAELNVFK